MLSLAIQHFVHLTREQRYRIHEGHELEVMGISVPVWFEGKDTSEPAKEVFCKYYIKNTKEDKAISILADGYEIVLPYIPAIPLDITNEEYRELNLSNPRKLDKLLSQTRKEISSLNLLDYPDRGAKRLLYREQNYATKNGKQLEIMNYICLESIESLVNSL